MRFAGLLLPTLLLCAVACSSGDEPSATDTTAAAATDSSEGPSRIFAMGFTPFPYAISEEALKTVDEYLARDGDLVVMHFDNGVPWQEASDGTEYPASLRAEVDRAVAAADAGQTRVLQFTPINFLRDGLATNVGNAPLQAPWDTREFDDQAVIQAFAAYAHWLIRQTDPDYVNYAIEANLLFEKSPEQWEALLRLMAPIYAELKSEYPDIGFFASIQVEAIATAPEAQQEAVTQMLAYSDLVAVSTYPFVSLGSVADIPDELLSSVAALAPDKPFAISETAWPAEDLGAPYPAVVKSTPQDQREYLAWLLDECERLACRFVNWFVVRDYDALYAETFGPDDPSAAIARTWRDTGLYDEDGGERPALLLWRQWLARPAH